MYDDIERVAGNRSCFSILMRFDVVNVRKCAGAQG